MDDPPPPYSSIDESKGAGYYAQQNFYPPGPPPSNHYYGATSYPADAGYQGPPRPGPGDARSYHPATTEPPPRVVLVPAGGTFFARFGGVQSLRQRYSTYGTHILLSCFVICCCGPIGFMCGVLAFCVAISAQSYAESSPQLARQLGRASMTLSLTGIAISVFTIAIVVATGGFQIPLNGTAAGNSTLDDYCPFPLGSRCFNSRQRVRSMKSCYDGYYLNRYCYRKEQM